MDKKKEIHEEIMSFLDSYLRETPLEVIEAEIAEISKIKFAGISARDYFSTLYNHSDVLEFDNRFLHSNVKINTTKDYNSFRNISYQKNFFRYDVIAQNTNMIESNMSEFRKYKSLDMNLYGKANSYNYV